MMRAGVSDRVNMIHERSYSGVSLILFYLSDYNLRVFVQNMKMESFYKFSSILV